MLCRLGPILLLCVKISQEIMQFMSQPVHGMKPHAYVHKQSQQIFL